MIKRRKKIAVVGAGGWGAVIANLLASKIKKVTLWTHEKDVVQDVNLNRRNSKYIPALSIAKNVVATCDPAKVHASKNIVLAVPTQYVRETLVKIDADFTGKKVVNLAKGVEKFTLKRVSEILSDFGVTPAKYCALTGPSHAEEVAMKTPTAVVAASVKRSFARKVQSLFSSNYFRVYVSEDVIGCEIGGAMKNVIAIAAGIIDGLKLGDNTKAALITRGLAEISRLGVALGADERTFAGLSGLGDLFVTCASRHSRNRMVGEQIGMGLTLAEIKEKMQTVAEGVETTESAYNLGKKVGVELPITEQMREILFKNKKPLKAIAELMERESKFELRRSIVGK